MAGRTVVVTGATSGTGLATAIGLAGLGAAVHIVGRNAARAWKARVAVEAAGPGPVSVDLTDMGDPGAVKELALCLAEQHPRLDALVHAAGSLSPKYGANREGTELTVATQVIGPYLLTAGLAANLWQGAACIVTMSSGGMYSQRFDLDRLEMTAAQYNGVVAYARAKRAQVVLADAWAARFTATGVPSYSMHPGWVDTPGLQAGLPTFRAMWRPLLRTATEGADTAVWLAAGGALDEGSQQSAASGFFLDRRRRATERFPVRRSARPEDATALLDWCATRTGTTTPIPVGPAERPARA
jgi:NAD(P)-dependent dehydrogenase (short-subunit alcohol dehydrogenase family)